LDDQGQVHVHDKQEEEEEPLHKTTSTNEEGVSAIESAREAAAKIKKVLTKKFESGDTSLGDLTKGGIPEVVNSVEFSKRHTLEETLGLAEEGGEKVAS